MLLALGCGVAIMLAGAVFLFQLTRQDDVASPTPLGEPVDVADMRLIADAANEVAGELAITVTIGGVDDADGAAGFRLIASGRPLEPLPPGPDGCAATTVAPTTCVVRFDVSTADGDARVLFYDRGEDRARWVLG